MVTSPLRGGESGAVKSPSAAMEPKGAVLPSAPSSDQLTSAVVVNCRVPPDATLAVGGETVKGGGAVMVTTAVSDFEGSSTDAALTVAWAGFGTARGAV